MIYRVDLSEAINVTPLRTLFAMGDDQAHRFEIKLTRGAEPVDLAGSTVYGEFTNFTPHATTVNLKGMAEGGAAVVVLTKPCYTLEGRFALVIRVKGADGTAAVFYGDGYMRSTTADTVIDGDYIIYDVNTLLEKIAEVNAATSAANMAASSATSAAGSANAAAASATTAAQSANNAASSASTAAQAADEAAARLDGMTATAAGLPASSAPTVAVTTGEDGAKQLAFGIPKGDKGDTGATPQLTVTAKTGEPGTEVSAVQGGTPENPTLELTIPRGNTGDIGALTVNGKSPDASGAVTLEAGDVGARPDNWTPTAEDVGAADAKAGVPAGGASGQILKKSSGTDYDAAWAYPDIPSGAALNGAFGGRYLGTISSEAECGAFLDAWQVPAGKFCKADGSDCLKLGDYITFSNCGAFSGEWMIAGFDLHLNVGDTLDALDGVKNAGANHHLNMIPRGAGFAYGSQMNSSNTTSGGYAGSAMKTYLTGTAEPALAGGLGSHLLARRTMLSNAVNTSAVSPGYAGWTGAASGWSWYTARAELMSEVQVYGSSVWGGGFDTGEACEQLPVFHFVGPVAYGRGSFWLRSVASSSFFASCGGYGNATCDPASDDWLFVRPLICVG